MSSKEKSIIKDVEMNDNIDMDYNIPQDNMRRVIEINKPKKLNIQKVNKSEEKNYDMDDYFEDDNDNKVNKNENRKPRKNTKEIKRKPLSSDHENDDYVREKPKSKEIINRKNSNFIENEDVKKVTQPKAKKMKLRPAKNIEKQKPEPFKPSINLDKGKLQIQFSKTIRKKSFPKIPRRDSRENQRK